MHVSKYLMWWIEEKIFLVCMGSERVLCQYRHGWLEKAHRILLLLALGRNRNKYDDLLLIEIQREYRYMARCKIKQSDGTWLRVSTGIIAQRRVTPGLDCNFFNSKYCSTFVCIWQLVSNYGLIRLKRFISWFTTKLYN
jgi:hypothetical protein